MPIYTHARQFPHLAGKNLPEIREIARRGMARHPGLARMIRLRNAFVIFAMTLSGTLLARMTSLDLGVIFVVIGGASTAFILVWNLVWVNTALFSITQEEVGRPVP